MFLEFSDRSSVIDPPINGTDKYKILLFNQFYIPENPRRYAEIKECLLKNVENSHVDSIYLLNERIYNIEELGIESDKIIQVDISRRMLFSDIFHYVTTHNINGYIVIMNSDIFIDDTIERLHTCDISQKKAAYALLRYEYTNDMKPLSSCKLFGSSQIHQIASKKHRLSLSFITSFKPGLKLEPRINSQDSWIFHTNYIPSSKELVTMDFSMGVPGCDNKLIYLLKVFGYQIYNDPHHIRTYHNHASNIRTYDNGSRLSQPYFSIIPIGFNSENKMAPFHDSLQYTNQLSFCHFSNDNVRFKEYLMKKIAGNEHFIVPRIACVENNIATSYKHVTGDKLDTIKRVMKNNAGIKLSSSESITDYSNKYMSAFEKCELYACWEPWGNVYKSIETHDIIVEKYKKDKITASVFDIFHYIHNPWTHALDGKRILIISAFSEMIKTKISTRDRVYGIDLFPNCEFVFMTPPQTQVDEPSDEFTVELERFRNRVDLIKESFDVALVSCGGYGNLVCSFIHDMKKSAIYVGGVLQMYFGIYGNRWLTERPDIMKLFKNEYWTRPTPDVRPKNHDNVEGGCYW
jgi:hypothetical protein